MLLNILLLFVGFIFLIKGADFLVESSAALANKWGIPPLVIGLTIVAFGTSMPELVVSIMSGLQGSSDLAITNILGSNIANILLILGIASIIYPLKVTRGTVWKEIPLSLLAIIILAILSNDQRIDGLDFSALTRGDGLTLLGFFLIFLYYVYGISKTSTGVETEVPSKKQNTLKLGLMMGLGLTGLFLGGDWVVKNAMELAKTFGMSEKLIGLTIVAVGTSLPELVTSSVAALKKQADIAVGNVVGSNIFNVFLVLGVSSTIRPIHYSPDLNLDIGLAILASILLFFFTFLGKVHHLERYQGIIFLLMYFSYISFLVVRG